MLLWWRHVLTRMRILVVEVPWLWHSWQPLVEAADVAPPRPGHLTPRADREVGRIRGIIVCLSTEAARCDGVLFFAH